MAVWTIAFNLVTGNIVSPLVYGRTVHLHPAIVLVAIPAGSAVAGMLGMFLVVPAIGVVAATWRTVLAILGNDEMPAVTDAAVAPADRPPLHRPRLAPRRLPWPDPETTGQAPHRDRPIGRTARPGETRPSVAFAIALSDEQWELVADLFDPPGRRGAPAAHPAPGHGRRDAVHLPHRLPVALPARALPHLDRGLGAVAPLAGERGLGARDDAPRRGRADAPRPGALPVDGHGRRPDREGRPLRTDLPRGGWSGWPDDGAPSAPILVDILGLPVAARVDSARPHDVQAGRELLRERIDTLPRLRAIVGDRAYRGLAALAERKHIALDIKAPPPGVDAFTPIWPLYKVEHTIAQLGRWRRLSRCYEGSPASARAWLEVASVGYLAWRAVV